ncbi:MAG: phenylphosphate carboxylase subunit delta [Burkholderiaceae bacterium]|jgi:3-deoxy-D-manno-octulosonate 8-phosphate phosphatase (KDO 8-P phosphatase)|nr:phenylphosphate carboxylase subunit delta [Burkholderiaceae bacterium]
MSRKAKGKARNVKLMIFDVDGILTDGRLFFGADGEAVKAFNVLDGHGIRMLQAQDIPVALISARNSPAVMRRSLDLGILHTRLGEQDKLSAFQSLLEKMGLRAPDCGYMGDDVLDLPVLIRAGFSASVPAAHEEVRTRVDYVTAAGGGQGAVREVCDLILKAQGRYDAAMKTYLING